MIRKIRTEQNPRTLGMAIRILLMVVIAGGTAIPIFWMVSTSLKPLSEIFAFPPKLFPHPIRWQNYVAAVRQLPFFTYLANSLYLAVANVVGTVVSALIVAYGFAKVEWRGRGVMFGVLLLTMFLPGTVTLVPSYILFHDIHWTGTYLPLIVPLFFGPAFFVFLFQQFFRTIPNSYSEAARIDGASEWRILWRILVPMSKPAIASAALLSFNASWDSFLIPLVFLNKPQMFTLPIGLYGLISNKGTEWTQLMAACVLFMLPLVVTFVIAQRSLISGIQIGGIRE